MPARELCRMAREKGVLTLVDGAQSLGLIEVNLAEMQPDFYTSSAHKWPCGPKEVGVSVHQQSSSKPHLAQHRQRLSRSHRDFQEL